MRSLQRRKGWLVDREGEVGVFRKRAIARLVILRQADPLVAGQQIRTARPSSHRLQSDDFDIELERTRQVAYRQRDVVDAKDCVHAFLSVEDRVPALSGRGDQCVRSGLRRDFFDLHFLGESMNLATLFMTGPCQADVRGVTEIRYETDRFADGRVPVGRTDRLYGPAVVCERAVLAAQ
jgi:hypothetical protein